MKVILKEDVKGVGRMGEIVSVKDGYARNFLVPRDLATEASTKNMRTLEHEQRLIQARARKVRSGAEGIADRIAATMVTIRAKVGEEDKLFGSVTAMDIAEALKNAGIEVDKKKILLDEPIKRLGEYIVAIKLHANITAQLGLQVIAE